MKTSTIKISLAIIGLGTALALTSCSSTSSGTTGAPAVAGLPPGETLLIPATSLKQLKPGLTAKEITTLLGQPQMVRSLNVKGIQSEIWVYRVSTHDTSTQDPTGTRDEPYVNPITGDQQTIKEPVYQTKVMHVYQTLELLMINGKLEQRKTGRPQVEVSYI